MRVRAWLLVALLAACRTQPLGEARRPLPPDLATAPDLASPDGACQCGPGFYACGAQCLCVDYQNDPQHCGSCAACPPGAACIRGLCVLPPDMSCPPILECFPIGAGCCTSIDCCS